MSNIYIPEALREKLEKVHNYDIIAFEAPTGYGKSAIIRQYMQETDNEVAYINVVSDAEDIFCEDLAYILENCSDKDCKTYVETFIEDSSDIRNFRALLRNIKTSDTKYIVIDNWHMVSSELTIKLIEVFAAYKPENIKLLLLSKHQLAARIQQLVIKDEILLLDRQDFEFDKNDIAAYFNKSGIIVHTDQLQYVMDHSQGWICVINIILNSLKTADMSDLEGAFFGLVDNFIWDFLNSEEKRVVISLAKLSSFTSAQAEVFFANNKDIAINKVLFNNPFMLYDRKTKKYRVHYILSEYVKNEFEGYSVQEKSRILKNTAIIHQSLGNAYEALKAFYEAGDWLGVTQVKFVISDLYQYVTNENKEFFLTIIKELPEEYKLDNLNFMMLMCMVLFLYNDRENMFLLYNEAEALISKKENISQKERDVLLGRLAYVRGYIEFNDIDYMTSKFMDAINLLEGSNTGYVYKYPWNFGVPSIMHLYHRTMGSLDEEVDALKKCMPFYYRITNGHGKGAEAVFDAEALFMTGDFKGAEILCYKAAYMADSREQICISLCALLILARMNLQSGNYDKYIKSLSEFEVKAATSKMSGITTRQMVDLCEATIHIITGNIDKMAAWLTDWETIEMSTNIISRCYANVIYGKYLYLNQEYEKLLGISGQFLGIAAVSENIIPRIYTYIYIAMANKAIGENEKAIKMLRVAFDFAVDDNIIMPFVENSQYIEDIYNNIAFDKEYRDFLRKIKQHSKDYIQGIKLINKNFKNRDNYGLTAREYDVAKLAAERLSNKEIAERLFIAESTVKSNLKVVFNKLNINSRAQLRDLF